MNKEQPILNSEWEAIHLAERPTEQGIFWTEFGHPEPEPPTVEAQLSEIRQLLTELNSAPKVGDRNSTTVYTGQVPSMEKTPKGQLVEKQMKRKARVERLVMEKRNPRFPRHLFLSDTQAPDHNEQAIKSVLKFIPDFAPDELHLVGDMMNFTKAGKFSVDQRYDIGLQEEIEIFDDLLERFIKTARKANPEVAIKWYEGNHEYRLLKLLARDAPEIRNLKKRKSDQELVSVPQLFDLEERGVEWISYYQTHEIGGKALVEHGDIARTRAGYSAQGMLDKRGQSGFSGHTHKLAQVSRRQGGNSLFWVETGSLCNPEPTPKWTKKPDWVNGFAYAIYDKKMDILHPTAVLMQENTFTFGGKVYK